MVGTFDGFGAWLGMVAKSAFALVGVGFYLEMSVEGWDDPLVASVIAVSIAVILGSINAFGSKEAGIFQTVLVAGLAGLSVYFIGRGSSSMETGRLLPFAPRGRRKLNPTPEKRV